MTEVYQIPDAVSPLRHRYDCSLTRNSHEPPDEVQAVLNSASKVVTPALCRGSERPKACPDAIAWRSLSKRAALLETSHGMGRSQLLVSLRKWRPPMLVHQEDPTIAATLKLQEAAAQQRRFCRQFRPADADIIDLRPLIDAAEGVADVLEKRYRDQRSKAWERWCQGSLAVGGRQVIRWVKAPEHGLQAPNHEAPGRKLARIHEEWTAIWGASPPAAWIQHQPGGPNLLSRVCRGQQCSPVEWPVHLRRCPSSQTSTFHRSRFVKSTGRSASLVAPLPSELIIGSRTTYCSSRIQGSTS